MLRSIHATAFVSWYGNGTFSKSVGDYAGDITASIECGEGGSEYTEEVALSK